ncbi:translation initiation factor IF-2 [Verrucomicrobiales bacterium]|nr:translation initiation factor IF-2 [Verrucomicrobiales bacterium]
MPTKKKAVKKKATKKKAAAKKAAATPKKKAAATKAAEPKETVAKPAAAAAPAAEEPAEASKSVATKKEEALNIFDKPKKKRVRKRAGVSDEPVVPEGPPKRTVEDDKNEALSLFEETERRTATKGKKKILGDAQIEAIKGKNESLPPISKLKTDVDSTGSADWAKMKAKNLPEADGGEEMPEPADAEVVETESSDEDGDEKTIHIKPPIIVKDLAERMGLKPFLLIKDLIELDVFADTNKAIEPDIAAKVCEKHGFTFEKEKREKGGGVHKVEEVIEEPEAPEVEEVDKMELRAPIVTMMGHVDHGKTSLLDAIRGSKVTDGEAGGITQHVAAYRVDKGDLAVTFIDTPGHAAFTQMRSRGAKVTDIVILVIAADDGLMPQTLEALNHARAAGVKIMVALNKCDLESADPNRVKGQLQEHDLAPEDWGGETSVTEVSAATGAGVDALFELIALEAEVLELKANANAGVRAPVIEARVIPGQGPTASVIVQSGTLKPGTPFICGPYWGKVKGLTNTKGERVKEAGPSTPVEVHGFSELPHVGDELVEMDSEKAAKKLSNDRVEERRIAKLSKPKRTLESLFKQAGGERPLLNLIIRSDVQGTAEAIVGALEDIPTEKVDLNFLHVGAGAITESDVLLAGASSAIVIGFNTKVESKAAKAAKSENVEVKLFSIIYELIDQVTEAMLDSLEPETREKVLGHAEVLQVFKVSKGRIGGSVVKDGKIVRGARARVLRGGQPIYDGGFHTLKRFTEDVQEVRQGLECGVKLGNYNDYEVGDIIECYELEKLAQTL